MTDPMQELERLRKELNYYKKLLAIMPGHIYWLDRNNVFLGSNIGHAKTAGLESPEQFIGTTPYDHTSSDYAQAVCEINERIMATGHEQVLEEVGAFWNGEERTYLSHKLPIEDDDGQVIGLLGVSLDITEKKRLEQALSKSYEEAQKTSEMLSNIIDLIPGHVCWTDRNNIVRGCNQYTIDNMGLAHKSEFIGKDLYSYFPQADADAATANNNRVMATGKAETLEEVGHFKGVLHNFLTKKRPLFDEQGNIVGVLGVSIDITTEKQLSQALQLSQQQFNETQRTLENILSLLPCHIYWKDREGHYLSCNELQAQAAGHENSVSFIGRTDFDDLSFEDAQKIRAMDLEVMATGKTLTVEETVCLPSGETHTYLSQKTPFRNSDSEILGILGISIDITAQKHLARELQAAQAKAQQTESTLDNLIALLPAMVYWKDRNGVYLGANDLEAVLAGFKHSKELIGKSDHDMAWKDYADALAENDKQVMAEAKLQTFEETIILAGETKERIFLSNKAPLRNAHNEIIGVMGVSFDITERKHLEQELYLAKQRAESALEHIIAIMPGHVYWEDKQGIILGCNDALAKALGLSSRTELIGKSIYAYLTPEQKAQEKQSNWQVMHTNTSITTEKQFINSAGNAYTLLSQKTPLCDKTGQVFGLLDTAVDITERKHMEKALQEAKENAEIANLAKTDFIASMSHDFRTPLNGIIGLAEILLMRIENSEYKEYIKNILDCGKVIANLIENILNYAQIESGRYELQNKSFNLRELIEHIITIIAPQAQQRGIELIVSYPITVPAWFVSDPLALNRILINLIGNSLKFTEKGHIIVKVAADTQHTETTSLTITVEDTGIGIAQDKIPHIFERFTRSEPSYVSKYKGSGLGLAIVEKLVKSLGGTVTVSSELGKGSCFTLTLPLRLKKPAKFKPNITAKTVLVIDTNAVRANLLAEQLMPAKCLVSAQIPSQWTDFTMVIIDADILNPAQETLLQQLSLVKPKKSLFILVTHQCSLEERNYYQALGFNKILLKPLHYSELIRLLDKP